ncbi:hypothetical protein OB905_07655 [Halobacteria archaeon AArc-dxtr1]|nr:hypothetical protein [Halobacteria archaeon AArc-dxtr1]
MTAITQFDPNSTAASDLVVRVLADHLNTSPIDLEPPLYESIDPEQLDRLVSHGDARIQVAFTHLEHEILVDSTGHIELGDGSSPTEERIS